MFFDPQVAAFCGDKRRLFLGEGKTKIFLNFFIAVVILKHRETNENKDFLIKAEKVVAWAETWHSRALT